MSTVHRIHDVDVHLPLPVDDAVAALATFEGDARVAAELVPDAFEVIETSPGRCQVAIAAVDYREIALGHYLEMGITFFVRPSGGPSDGSADGTFIWKLPVDSELSRAAGVDIWGFPKTVEQIDWVHHGEAGSLTARLHMDDQLVLSLTVPTGGDDDVEPSPMTTYTMLDGHPHAVPFSQGGTGSRISVGSNGVELVLGDHPVAKELARLGLPAPAEMTIWFEHMTGTFGEPQRL